MERNSTVFLRPNPLANRTNYVREVEKAGMVVLPQQNLAIYTCKTGAKQGPQGAPGDPGASTAALDTQVASMSDEWSPLVVDLVRPAVTFRAQFAMENVFAHIDCVTPSQGAEIIVDLHLNGVSMLSTYLHIDANGSDSFTSVTPAVFTITNVPNRGKFEAYIRQVGISVAGTGLKIGVTGNKVLP